jgi:hypothetical protein
MPVFAFYNLDDVGTTAIDSALANGGQNGLYTNGPTISGTQVVLDGVNRLEDDVALALAQQRASHDPARQKQLADELNRAAQAWRHDCGRGCRASTGSA